MSFQDQYGRNSYGRVPISSRNNATPQYDNQLFSSPHEYDNNIQAISNTIRQISANVAQIRQLASQIGTSKDSVDVREKMRSLIESTKTMVKDTAQEFKALETNEIYQQTLTQDERNKKRILQQKLMKDFQLTIQKFQEINKLSVEKEKANPLSNSKQPSQSSGNKNSDPFAGLTMEEPARNDYDLEAQRTKQFHIQNQLDFNEALIVDRDQGIRDIEKTVVEVNEIFRDLSKLVIEQGQMIDNIESNIESAVQDTNKGVVEIRKASDYQKRSRTKLCILALILVIIVSVIVLVVWLMYS